MEKPFIYFESNSGEYSFANRGDFYAVDSENKIFAVADSPTRYLTLRKRDYRNEDNSPKAAQLFCDLVVKDCKKLIDQNREIKSEDLTEIMKQINGEIKELNLSLGKKYKDRDNYDLAETVGAFGFIHDGKFYSGMLEDCYLNILRGKELADVHKTRYQIMKSYRYLEEVMKNEGPERFLTRDLKRYLEKEEYPEACWCNHLRNNIELKDKAGEPLGWGCFNGESEAETYFQTSITQLEKGDIIMIFSDGMIPILQNDQIFNWLKDNLRYDFHFQLELRKKIIEQFPDGEVSKKEKTLIYYRYN